jgi:drug/metabolite transporter (DMT)-like permease
MIDPYWFSLVAVLTGAFAGMILPYLIKCYEDRQTKFEFGYFYTLLVTAVISALGLIPAEINPSPQYYVGLILAGLGLQTVLSKAKTKRT